MNLKTYLIESLKRDAVLPGINRESSGRLFADNRIGNSGLEWKTPDTQVSQFQALHHGNRLARKSLFIKLVKNDNPTFGYPRKEAFNCQQRRRIDIEIKI